MSFWTYLLENAQFYLITLVTLFLWDIIDLYIELRSFSFVHRRPFLAYYVIIGFFSIATMEAGLLLNVFTEESKYLISFLIPLVFAVVLENLVVRIGGGEKSINFSDFFNKFRFAIAEHLATMDRMKKVRMQEELLNSEIPTEEILGWSRFYSTPQQITDLETATKNLDAMAKRTEVIKYLISQANTVDIIRDIREAKRKRAPDMGSQVLG